MVLVDLTEYGDSAFSDEPDYRAACAAGDAAVAELAGLEPGPELAAKAAAASQLMMSTDAQLSLYAAWERLRAWTDAMQMATASTLLPAYPSEGDAYLAADLGRMTGQSEASMGTRLANIRHIGVGLPATWEALRAGRITSTHAWVMVRATALAQPQLCQRVEAHVLEKAIAEGMTPGQLGELARRAIAKLDPDGAEQRAAVAKKTRSDVHLSPEEDEMARLTTRTDALTGRQLMDEINRRADERKRAGDERSLGLIRVDVVADALLGEPLDGEIFDSARGDDNEADGKDTQAVTNGRRVRMPKRTNCLVLVTLETLLGGSEPGHLDGYGPITAQLARKIAAGNTTFRRLVLDPLSGRPVDLGTTSSTLSAEQRRWIDVRDQTCRFPGCMRRAIYCDADHAEEFPAGETSCRNCGLLCRKHHNWKTLKDWDLIREDNDDVVWISPNGKRWRRKAATYKAFVPWPDEPPPDDVDDEAFIAGLIPVDPDPPDPDAPFPDDPTLTILPPACYCELDYDDCRRFGYPIDEVAYPH